MTKNQTNRKKYQVHNNNKSKKIRGGIAPAILLIENLPMIASVTLTGFDTLMKWLNTANTAISTYDKIKHHEPLINHPTPVPAAPVPAAPVPAAPTAPVASPPATPVTKKPPVKSPAPAPTKKAPVKPSSSTSMTKKPPVKPSSSIPMNKKK
uniref:Uncharacterized protein n=1 Tax=viral metagenome TaxID=1070528 RepID=A0A6C0HV05_9ZZZZ